MELNGHHAMVIFPMPEPIQGSGSLPVAFIQHAIIQDIEKSASWRYLGLKGNGTLANVRECNFERFPGTMIVGGTRENIDILKRTLAATGEGYQVHDIPPLEKK